ncbi:MAG: hypothetical protein CRN43_19160 [Candidatus Nephrothrix sp. EaCA]|nr:MAG: hypothetical protein CRN43_19160 [Candidatus Nephrothrix sp. EaCA]
MAGHLSMKAMLLKYIFGLLLLLICNISIAQELNSVLYACRHRQETIKKSGKKGWMPWTAETEDKEAQLIYAPDHLLFISAQGTDTVFLSKINKTARDFLGHRRVFYITYNSKSDFISLLFCKKKNAKKFKRFMLENGGQYKRNVVAKTLLIPLLLCGIGIPEPLPCSLSKWLDACQ